MDNRYFTKKVVEWYLQHKRELPWRETKDPYKIWLSEIILQQTRVNQGLPYYLKFVQQFPNVKLLAAAPEQKVLRLWQGLGYYTRARNLHKCAKTVVRNHQSTFPNNFESLRKLPGIGDYTAAAVASFAFKEAVAVVDGNVYRVLSRAFGVAKEINSPEGKKYFAELANQLVSIHHPDLYNQAIMEFGALHCTPRNPGCATCIFQSDCFAFKNGLQQKLPAKTKTKAARRRYFYYFVIQKGKSLLMKKRDQKDIWHGLYDFYMIEKSRTVNVEKLIYDDTFLKNLAGRPQQFKPIVKFKHVLSHQIILSKFIYLKTGKSLAKKDKKLKFYTPKQVSDLPKPVLISRFLKSHQLS